MQNPFESGHIKNYILLYASIVVIMVLFFIASSLFLEVENVEKKVFNTEVSSSSLSESNKGSKLNRLEESKEEAKTKFKLLEVNSDGYIKYNKSPEVNNSTEPK